MSNIIRTVEELEALDPDTFLLDSDDAGLTQDDWMSFFRDYDNHIFPLVVIATGDQIRQARRLLEEETK